MKSEVIFYVGAMPLEQVAEGDEVASGILKVLPSKLVQLPRRMLFKRIINAPLELSGSISHLQELYAFTLCNTRLSRFLAGRCSGPTIDAENARSSLRPDSVSDLKGDGTEADLLIMGTSD